MTTTPDQTPSDPLILDQLPAEIAPTGQGVAGDVSTAVPADKPSPELSERMRKVAQAPRTPRSLPKWMQRVVDETEALQTNPLLKTRRDALQAEVRAEGLTPAAAQVEHCARCGALVDMCDGALFALYGGPVNRHKRALHRLTEQRAELLATYLSMRQRLGLDAEKPEGNAFAAAIARSKRLGITDSLAAAAARDIEERFGAVNVELDNNARDLGFANFEERRVAAQENFVRLQAELNDPAVAAADLEKIARECREAHDREYARIRERASPSPSPSPVPPSTPIPPPLLLPAPDPGVGGGTSEVLPPDQPTPPARDVTPAGASFSTFDPYEDRDPNIEFRRMYAKLGTNPRFEK